MEEQHATLAAVSAADTHTTEPRPQVQHGCCRSASTQTGAAQQHAEGAITAKVTVEKEQTYREEAEDMQAQQERTAQAMMAVMKMVLENPPRSLLG